MQKLTPEGWQRVTDLSQRYGVSTDAVMNLLQSVVNGHGTMAQFNISELGGGGQWMQGGMTMVGDMFNYGLKSKVDGLCTELSNLLLNQPFAAPMPSSSQSQSQGNQQQAQGSGYNNNYNSNSSGSGVSLFVPPAAGSSGDWYPGGLGAPNAVGSQNNVRYAYFANARRLAVEVNGTLGLYDTQDHQIGGFSQQQGVGGSITFTSQYGTVSLNSLPVISIKPVGSTNGNGNGNGHSNQQQQQQPQPSVSYAQQAPAPSYVNPPVHSNTNTSSNSGSANSADIFATIEQLAGLKQKGILSDNEFNTKKNELLSRL